MEDFPVGWFPEFETNEEDAVLIHRMDSLENLTPQQMAALFEVDFQKFETCATTQLQTTTTSEHTSSAEAFSFQNVCRFGDSVASIKSKVEATPSDKCAPRSGRDSVASIKSKVEATPSDKCAPRSGNGRKRGTKPNTCTLDRVIAERKRREKFTQQFIALSAIIPHLTKMDKASVLEDCLKYVKHLQEKVKTLEEQASKTNMESTVVIKKYLVSSDSDSSSTDNISSEVSHEPLPEVEARISGRNVLIRIHCEKRKGIMEQVLLETETLNLTFISSCVMPFASSTLDISLLAEMDAGSNMTVTGLVRKLRSSIVQFLGKEVQLN